MKLRVLTIACFCVHAGGVPAPVHTAVAELTQNKAGQPAREIGSLRALHVLPTACFCVFAGGVPAPVHPARTAEAAQHEAGQQAPAVQAVSHDGGSQQGGAPPGLYALLP